MNLPIDLDGCVGRHVEGEADSPFWERTPPSRTGTHPVYAVELATDQAYRHAMGLGRGKTEHAGPRDMGRKHGHWGFTDEAKAWASRARRRDEKDELRATLAGDEEGRDAAGDQSPTAS